MKDPYIRSKLSIILSLIILILFFIIINTSREVSVYLSGVSLGVLIGEVALLVETLLDREF